MLNTTPTRFFPEPFRIDKYAPSSEPDLDIDPDLLVDEETAGPDTLADVASTHQGAPSSPGDQERDRAAAILAAAAARQHDEKLRRQRYESVQRLKTSWELLLEKYGDVAPEDDDEIDIVTGEVTVNRGRLRTLIPREFGEATDDEDDDEEDMFGPGVDDEDDEEVEEVEEVEKEDTPEPVVPPRTKEDFQDLEEFTRLENERRIAAGQAALEVENQAREQAANAARQQAPADGHPARGNVLAKTSAAEAMGYVHRDESPAVVLERSRQQVQQMLQAQPKFIQEDNLWKAGTLPPIGWLTEDRITPARDLSTPPPPDGAARPRASLASFFSQRIFSASPAPPDPALPAPAPAPTPAPVQATLPALEPAPAPASEHVTVPEPEPTLASVAASVEVRAPSPPPRSSPRPEQHTLDASASPHQSPSSPEPQPLPPKKQYKPRVPAPEITLADENPPPGLDPDAYYDKLMRTRNKVTLRYCRACYDAGGVLAERAVWCKGRFAPSKCRFHNFSDNEEAKEKKRRLPRHCKACRRAGGYRALRAMKCKGRKEPHLCKFLVDDVMDQEDHEEYVRQNPAPKRGSSSRSVGTAILPNINVDALDPRMYHKQVSYTHNGTRVRRCASCKYSGKWREDRAPWCFGRTRTELCKYLDGMVPEIGEDDRIMSDEEVVDAAVDLEAVEEPGEGGGGEGGVAEREREPMTLAEVIAREAAQRNQRALERGEEDEDGLSDTSEESPAWAHGSFLDGNVEEDEAETEDETEDEEAVAFQDSSDGSGDDRESEDEPEDEEEDEEGEEEEEVEDEDEGTLTDDVLESGWEIPIDSDDLIDPALRGIGGAAPFQSRGKGASGSPGDGLQPLPTYSFKSPVKALAAGIPFRPTPPSSGARTPSGSASALRRGILRHNSASDRPSSSARKQTRFSLIPMSPTNNVDFDTPQLAFELDEDDLLLGPDSSPVGLVEPQPPSTASPPPAHPVVVQPLTEYDVIRFSTEVSVRAADVGFNLAQHTGRVPSEMLAALAPSLGQWNASSTLASAMQGNEASGGTRSGYALPTPPPSTGLDSSTSETGKLDGIVGHTADSRPNGQHVAEDDHRNRLPTPSWTEDGEANNKTEQPPDGISTKRKRARPKSMSALQDRPGVWSALNRGAGSTPRSGRGKGRASMPSSVRLGPVEASDKETPSRSSSVPRKRSKLEKTLAVVAQTVGDESLEWGMDEDVGEDNGRLWREGTVVHYLM